MKIDVVCLVSILSRFFFHFKDSWDCLNNDLDICLNHRLKYFSIQNMKHRSLSHEVKQSLFKKYFYCFFSFVLFIGSLGFGY